jgi:hypothetical protein
MQDIKELRAAEACLIEAGVDQDEVDEILSCQRDELIAKR